MKRETIRRGQMLALIFFAVLIVPQSASPETIPAVTNRLAAGDRVERDYVGPLGIEGRSAAFALDTLLAEGFRCGILPAGEYAPGADPMWHCRKQPSGFGPHCDDLSVPARFAQPLPWATRDELLVHLDDIRVRSVRVFCSPSRKVPAEFLAARGAAETELQAYIRSLELPANGQSAYKKLLLSGFYCGFASPRSAKVQTPEMVCTKTPSQIKFCAEAKVVLSVSWPADTASNHSYGALQLSIVREARSSCQIPAVGGVDVGEPS